MKLIVFILLSIPLSEVIFLLTYLAAYMFCSYAALMLATVLPKILDKTTHAFIGGIVSGLAASFATIGITHYFFTLVGGRGSLYLPVSMLLPAIGWFGYFEHIFKSVAAQCFVPAPLYGRLHSAMMAIPQRLQFEYSKAVLEHANPEEKAAKDDSLGHLAYSQTQKYLLQMTLFSLLGMVIGMILACHAPIMTTL